MYIPIKETGKKIKFFIKGLYSVENKSSFDNISKVWYLDIECKELEDMRYFYHLSPKLKAHNFLLPIAVKKETANLKKMPLPEMKINISYHAA